MDSLALWSLKRTIMKDDVVWSTFGDFMGPKGTSPPPSFSHYFPKFEPCQVHHQTLLTVGHVYAL